MIFWNWPKYNAFEVMHSLRIAVSQIIGDIIACGLKWMIDHPIRLIWTRPYRGELQRRSVVELCLDSQLNSCCDCFNVALYSQLLIWEMAAASIRADQLLIIGCSHLQRTYNIIITCLRLLGHNSSHTRSMGNLSRSAFWQLAPSGATCYLCD